MSAAVLFAALLAQAAAAPEAVAPPAPPAPKVAAAACKKPDLPKRLGLTQEDYGVVGEASQAYLNCMRPYIEERSRQANALMAEAKANAEANNAAVTEVNAFVTAYREWAAESQNQQK